MGSLPAFGSSEALLGTFPRLLYQAAGGPNTRFAGHFSLGRRGFLQDFALDMNVLPPRGRYFITATLNTGQPTGGNNTVRPLVRGYFTGEGGQPLSRVNYPVSGGEVVNWVVYSGSNGLATDRFMLYGSVGPSPLPGFHLWSEDVASGLGERFAVYPPAPAMGADASVVVPPYVYWRIRAVTFQLVTSAVAGSRVPWVRFVYPANPITSQIPYQAFFAPSSVSTVSSTYNVTFSIADALENVTTGLLVGGALPNCFVSPVVTVDIGADALLAGDLIQNVILDVEEFAAPLQVA